MLASRGTLPARTALSPVLLLALAIFISGCGEFVGYPEAEYQSDTIRRDVMQIARAPEPNIVKPEFYTQPPKIIEQTVGGGPEFKLVYFTQYHTADYLKQIIHEQFATKLFNEKGKSTSISDYTVSSNPATNQLIIRTPSREDARAVLEVLEAVDVPPIQVKIDCVVSEVYADKTMDWETILAIDELFGEDISLQPGSVPFGEDVQKLVEEGTILPAFPGASLREVYRAKMGLLVGYSGAKYTALIDLLESKGYLKVLMNPSLEVVNGKTARIMKSEHVPLQRISNIITGGPDPIVKEYTEYVDVVDSLNITPHVFADGSIGLETKILLGSKNTPEGVKQIPIVTKKEIDNEENRIRQGESLVIGGIRKTEQRDVIRGVPFLKELPVIGVLFSGRDFEERVVETVFIITPSISSGGVPREEMTRELQRKHENGRGEDGKEPLDLFGFEAHQRQQEQRSRDVEHSRLEAEAEKAEARQAARIAERKQAEAEQLKTQAEQQMTEAQQALAEAQAKQARAEQALQQAKQAEAAAQKQSQAELEKAKQARADAEKLKAEAQKALQQAEAKKAEAEKVRAEAEKAKAEAEKARPEADEQATQQNQQPQQESEQG